MKVKKTNLIGDAGKPLGNGKKLRVICYHQSTMNGMNTLGYNVQLLMIFQNEK